MVQLTSELAFQDTMEKEDITRLNLEEAYVGNDRSVTSMVVDDDDLDEDDDDLEDDDLDLDVDDVDVVEGDDDELSSEVVPLDEDLDEDLDLDEDDDDDEEDEL